MTTKSCKQCNSSFVVAFPQQICCNQECKKIYQHDNYKKWLHKRRHGITIEERAVIFKNQGSKCRICERKKAGGTWESWNLDHDHKTGRIRGVLCHSCNVLLGHAKDSTELLEKAIKYLKGD